jgi:chromosomal replication initiator protein
MSHDRKSAPVRAHNIGVAAAFEDVQAELRGAHGVEAYRSWIEPMAYAGEMGGTLYFRAHGGVARDWLNRNVHDALENSLRTRLNVVSPVAICVEGDLPASLRGAATDAAAEPAASGGLAPVNQTFDTYCVGDGNRAAVFAARSVVDGGSAASSLVLFHGPHGAGKTHLVNAIAHEARRKSPARRVRYMMSSLFIDEFLSALQKKRDMSAFKAQMRDVDLLILDDVQLFMNKPATEQELFTTLSIVLSQGGQVVLTADHGAEGLDGFEVRLRNQLRAATDILIDAPDFELRRKILESKVKLYAATLASFDVPGTVLDMIASRIRGTGRALDAAIRQLYVELALADKEITMDSAERVLASRFVAPERRPTVEQIIAQTAKYYNLTTEQLLAPTHQRAIARPRQIAMFLCRALTRRSLPDLAKRFGGKHHTTILWATGRIEALIETDEQVRVDVEAVRRLIQGEPERSL